MREACLHCAFWAWLGVSPADSTGLWDVPDGGAQRNNVEMLEIPSFYGQKATYCGPNTHRIRPPDSYHLKSTLYAPLKEHSVCTASSALQELGVVLGHNLMGLWGVVLGHVRRSGEECG